MAPFSFIKTSTLIFAYLFLWYQTNYQHQVSALSTLKDDDISDGSNSTLSSSSEGEDIKKTNVRAQTLGSDGPHVPHKGYGDYHPPQGGVDSAHAAQWNTPRDRKNVKDQFRRICKKIFCRRAMKHRSILLLILGILTFCPLLLCFVTANPTVLIGDTKGELTLLRGTIPHDPSATVIGLAALTVLGLLILVGFLGCHYYRARKKYIEKKKNTKHYKY